MHSRIHFFIFSVCCLVLVCGFGFAQDAASSASGGELSFPYWGQITGDNVYVRSGPGTHLYRVGILNSGDIVRVVSQMHSWSQIVPPAGSFSWVAKKYINVDAQDPKVGTINGDGVQVWAGSPHLNPLYSTTRQGKLDKGDKVKLLGEEMGDYYKIEPPSFAYLWISTQFTNPVPMESAPPTPEDEILPAGGVQEMEDTLIDFDQVENTADTSKKVDPNAGKMTDKKVADFSVETQMLEKYHRIEEKIEAENVKSFEERDYTTIKQELQEIASNEDAGKAGKYADFAIKQIDRYELAKQMGTEVEQQQQELEKQRDAIEAQRQERLNKIKDLSAFVVMGIFRDSKVYEGKVTKQFYRIVDENGKTVCYAVPKPAIEGSDFSKMFGKKVGLIGSIKPHLETSGALVEFSDIKLVD